MQLETERLVLRAPRLDNVRSARVAEKLGARPERQVETEDGPANVWVHPR